MATDKPINQQGTGHMEPCAVRTCSATLHRCPHFRSIVFVCGLFCFFPQNETLAKIIGTFLEDHIHKCSSELWTSTTLCIKQPSLPHCSSFKLLLVHYFNTFLNDCFSFYLISFPHYFILQFCILCLFLYISGLIFVVIFVNSIALLFTIYF